MRNRPLKKELLKELERWVPQAQDTNQAITMLITQLAHYHMRTLLCYEELKKYETSRIIRILRKLRVIRL